MPFPLPVGVNTADPASERCALWPSNDVLALQVGKSQWVTLEISN